MFRSTTNSGTHNLPQGFEEWPARFRLCNSLVRYAAGPVCSAPARRRNNTNTRLAPHRPGDRREAAQPYGQQRYVDVFGTSAAYGWSEDKARQYAVPERADFGAYVRARGFRLD